MDIRTSAFTAFYAIIVVSTVGVSLMFNIQTVESLTLEDYTFHARGGTRDCLFLKVKNTGTANVVVVEVLVNTQPYCYVPEGYEIPVGHAYDGIGIWFEWKSHEHYWITLITKTGKTYRYMIQAPQKEPPLEIDNILWNSTDYTVSFVVRNIGTRERNVTWFSQPIEAGWTGITRYTNIGSGKIVQVDQTFTIILDWLSCFREPWISDKTYYFIVQTDNYENPPTEFHCRAPSASMPSEDVKITDLYFYANTIRVTVKNRGIVPVTISQCRVNNVEQTITAFTVEGNSQYLLNLTYSWTQGYNYEVMLTTTQGNIFLRTETAPST